MNDTLSWMLTALAAILIIVVGFEGNAGTVLGCIFTPTYIVVGETITPGSQ